MTSPPPLTVRGLKKHYPDTVALIDLDLEVQPGEIVGLLGRNGAGKTTTVRLVVGLERPTAGDVRIFGLTPSTASKRNLIGYCSQDLALYPSRSVVENLVFFAMISGMVRSEATSAANTTANLLGLTEHMRRRSSDLSGGFKRRVHLGIALIGGAPLLVLDEPTGGVDIESRELIIDLVRILADKGNAVLYTSHDLTEVERLCHRVIILSRGAMRAMGTVDELSNSVGQLIRLEFEEKSERDLARRSLPGTLRLFGSAGLDVQLDRTQSATDTVGMIQGSGWTIRRLEVLAPGLESIFLQVTQHEG